MKLPKTKGLLQDSFDPRDVWEDEILGGESEPMPASYLTEGIPFAPQGSYPYCVAFSVSGLFSLALRQSRSVVKRFSEPHVFHRAGGSRKGTTFRSVLNVAVNDGLLSYPRLPMPENIWTLSEFDKQKQDALDIPFTDVDKIPGYVRVKTDRDSLKRAIMRYGGVLVGVYANGGWWTDGTERKGNYDDHAVKLVGWHADDSWIVHDSLQPRADFDGYHRLSADYGFNSAYAITELPVDWREQRDEKRKEGFEHCLNHYGQPRDFAREQLVAAEMVKEFQKFNNQSVWEAAGKFWTVYVNAIVYGGYNLSYRKWGRWMPGDVINDCYHWRRTGEHIFDFNKLRSEHV